ncbi:MAG: hypothetical protein E7661_00255 [Ruminococcaceae bacterium]|nr:hypothetical protein [Oscillospiraceae bacterium]
MKHIHHTFPKPWQRLLSAILLVAMALAAILPVNAAEEGALPIAPPADTAMGGSTAEISPAALLTYILGQPLTEAEEKWLDAEAGKGILAELSLTYDSTVPHEQVTVTFPEGGKATVTARTYLGETLGTAWTPVSVQCGAETHPLLPEGKDTYAATFPVSDTLLTVTVHYEAELICASASVNTLLNAAYTRGTEILSAYDEYEQALADHTAAYEAYQAYRVQLQQYRSDLALYNAYLSDKKVYDERKAVYEAYLAEMATYEKKLATYNAYLEEKAAYDAAYKAYVEFTERPAEYEKKYYDYCEYLTKLEKIRAQLALVDSCFVSDSEGHILNATLNGPTVATVVARQDELVSVGCDATDIANADAATAQLIALLGGYPKDGEESERYAYYLGNYTAIRDNVTLLYTSLSRLYGNDAVPDILQMQGKKERYWQFVAQLYALSSALDDTVTFNVNWSISNSRLTDLLEDCFILTDINAATPLDAYPPYMAEVISPGDMKKPVEPTVVAEPVPPLKVSEPTAPTVVNKPVLPTVVQAPGQRPVRPIYNAYEEALAQAVTSGQLKKREALSENASYPLAVEVGKSASAEGSWVASFYDYDRTTLLYACTADENGRIAWPADTPQRPTANGIIYTFSGWTDGAGELHFPGEEGLTIQKDTDFYAAYTTQKATYTVTWRVEGMETRETYEHGDMPAFDGVPEKAEDDTYRYTFVGWSPAMTPVTAEATYTAVFAPVEKEYEVQWVIGSSTETEVYASGEMPVSPIVPTLPMDGRYTYVFKGFSPGIGLVTADTVYTAVFEAVDLLPGAGKDAMVSEQNGTLTVTNLSHGDMGRLPMTALLDYASGRSCDLVLSMDNVTLLISSEDVSTLASTSAAYLVTQGLGQTAAPMFLEFLDASLQPISVSTEIRMNLTLSKDLDALLTDPSGKVISALSEGTLVANLKTETAYTLTVGYGIHATVTVDGTKNDAGGLCLLPSVPTAAGDRVSFRINAAPGYGLTGVILRDAWGTVIKHTVDDAGVYHFVMPEGDVEVSVDFTPLTYTVVFIDRGNVIASETYRYGEMPTIPSDPVREEDGQFSYTFTGWTPTVTAVMKDVTYEATFLSVPLNGQDAVVDSGIGILELFFIGFGAFVVTCGGILVPYVIVSKNKKKKTAAEDTDN